MTPHGRAPHRERDNQGTAGACAYDMTSRTKSRTDRCISMGSGQLEPRPLPTHSLRLRSLYQQTGAECLFELMDRTVPVGHEDDDRYACVRIAPRTRVRLLFDG